MEWRLKLILLVNVALCSAIRYECEKSNVSCGCAFKNVEVGDDLEEAIPYSWSMMVSIRYDCRQNGNSSTHCCAGTILNERYILTAARCFDPAENSSLSAENITIAANIHRLSQNCPTIRTVERTFLHPNWSATNEALHNIAILRLAEPLDFQTDFTLSSACLPSQMNTSVEMISNTSLVVVGWSVLSNTEENLQQLTVYPIDFNDSMCSRASNDPKLSFCAGRYGAACFPEVGGPAFQWSGTHWELVGIESYAFDGCPRVGYKGLFVRVAAYLDWIESILNIHTAMTSTTPEPPIYNYECDRNMPCGCGYTDVVFRPTRIMGGEDAIEHSWSMIVSLRFYGSQEHFCAGTLLSSSHILTAAHCVAQFLSSRPVNISIIAGITNRSDPEAYQRNIDRIHIHENYTDRPHYLNDIAILRMDRPLYFLHNPILAKTCVNPRNISMMDMHQYPKPGTRLVVIGWGAMKPGSFLQSEYLQQIRISTIDNQDPICQKIVSSKEHQFCAGLYNGGKDACLGDSGGPILQWTGQYWEQVGIIGHNFQCGRPEYPGVYTRLGQYLQWIAKILNETNEYLEPQWPLRTTTTTTTTRRPNTTTTRRTRPPTATSNRFSSFSAMITDILRRTDSFTAHVPLVTMPSDIPRAPTGYFHTSRILNTIAPLSLSLTVTSQILPAKLSTSAMSITIHPFTSMTSAVTRVTLDTSKMITATTTRTSYAPHFTAAITTNRLQPTYSARTDTMITTNLFPSHLTAVTSIFRNKITYECDRIQNECGCSLANVVLSYDNQRTSPIDTTNEDAYPYSWSMVVSIRINNTKHICMGTILSDSFILTTAQCVNNYRQNPNNITIAGGVHSLSQYSASHRTVVEIHIHENYTTDRSHLHDIAILRLGHPLDLITQPIFAKTCLSNSLSPNLTGDTTLVTIGWQNSAFERIVLDTLQQVSTKSMNDSDSSCFNSTYDNRYQLCAGAPSDKTGTCNGNFGEPIFVYRNKYWEQVGMLSKTQSCTVIGHSGVYTRLSAYTKWIQHLLKTTPIPSRRPATTSDSSKIQRNFLSLSSLLLITKLFTRN
ncbi:unnamed protein product [Adineta ricciae]|uniref:Peptidase S1 domain-containing protein n=1 Tax=Adineta ricciae TaxID=249248 RepID=A0A814IQM2_ADIRI|nr:unnamed protein product [Adineta ricciae]CAF1180143.1 unnamed protein product [Adineta ricciae]